LADFGDLLSRSDIRERRKLTFEETWDGDLSWGKVQKKRKVAAFTGGKFFPLKAITAPGSSDLCVRRLR